MSSSAPRRDASKEARRRIPPPARVLVVDDSVDSAESIAELLRIWNYEVRVSHDGVQALDEAQSFRPAVILMDIGLPGLSGYEVAGRLRHAGLAGDLLVALTGYGDEEDRQRALEAGFDRHLTKPVHPELLKQVLQGEG